VIFKRETKRLRTRQRIPFPSHFHSPFEQPDDERSRSFSAARRSASSSSLDQLIPRAISSRANTRLDLIIEKRDTAIVIAFHHDLITASS